MACEDAAAARRTAGPGSALFVIVQARTADAIDGVRDLFVEYGRTPHVEECVTDFQAEIARLPGVYAEPTGVLLLATVGSAPAGCVGVRPLTDGAAELKRLFVRPAYRGRHIGEALSRAAIEAARSVGHLRLCLSTLETMTEARALYSRLGFRESAPFNDPPIPGATYLELVL